MEWSWQHLGPGPGPVVLEEQAVSRQLLSCGCASNGASRDPQALQPTLEHCLSGSSRLSGFSVGSSLASRADFHQAPLPSQATWASAPAEAMEQN